MGSPSAAQPVERFFQASFLGLLTSGFLALAFSGYLDPATSGLTLLGLLGRALRFRACAPNWDCSPAIANALTIAYIGFYPLDSIYFRASSFPRPFTWSAFCRWSAFCLRARIATTFS